MIFFSIQLQRITLKHNTIIKRTKHSQCSKYFAKILNEISKRINTLLIKKLLLFSRVKFIHRSGFPDAGRSCKLIRNTDQSSNNNKNKINANSTSSSPPLTFARISSLPPWPTCHADSADFRCIHSTEQNGAKPFNHRSSRFFPSRGRGQ